MIKHIVMWKLKNKENASAVKDKLETMTGRIPQIKKLEVGVNMESGLTSHDIVLITYHDTEDELYEYQDHDYHQEIKKFIPLYCTDRCCIDFRE